VGIKRVALFLAATHLRILHGRTAKYQYFSQLEYCSTPVFLRTTHTGLALFCHVRLINEVVDGAMSGCRQAIPCSNPSFKTEVTCKTISFGTP
jgi:hypothetical protein